MSPSVIGCIGDVVGTETVGISDGIGGMMFLVFYYQSRVLHHDDSDAVAQLFFEDGIVFRYIFITPFDGVKIDHVEHSYSQGLVVNLFCDAHLIILNLIYITVVDDEP